MLIEYTIPTITLFAILLLHWFLPSIMSVTLPFGVRIPEEQSKHPVILHVKRDYQTGIIIIALIIGAAGWFCATHYSASFAGISGIFAALILAGLNYYAAHKRIAEVKARENWYKGLHQVVMTDTSLHMHPIRPSLRWLLPSLILLAIIIITAMIRYPALPAIIPTHFDAAGNANGWLDKTIGVFVLPLVALIMTALMVFLAYKLPNTRLQIDPTHPQEDMQYLRKYRTMLANMLLIIATAVNLTFCTTALITYQVLPAKNIMLHTFILAVALILPISIIMATIFMMNRQHQARLVQGRNSRYAMRDDDKYWIAGMIYNNPEDPSLMVEKRFGIGWTLNIGHPQAKLIVAALVFLIILLKVAPMITSSTH